MLDFSFRNLSIASNGWNLFFCPLVFVCLHTLLFVPVLLLVIQKICNAFDFEVTRISFFGFFVILFSYLSLSLFEGFEKSFLEVEELA